MKPCKEFRIFICPIRPIASLFTLCPFCTFPCKTKRKGSSCENIAVTWVFQQQNLPGSSTSVSQLPCSSETLSYSILGYLILTFHILGSTWVFLHGTWLVSLLISCLQQAAFHMAFLFSSRPRSKGERSRLSARSSFSAVGLWRVGCPEKNRTMDKII